MKLPLRSPFVAVALLLSCSGGDGMTNGRDAGSMNRQDAEGASGKDGSGASPGGGTSPIDTSGGGAAGEASPSNGGAPENRGGMSSAGASGSSGGGTPFGGARGSGGTSSGGGTVGSGGRSSGGAAGNGGAQGSDAVLPAQGALWGYYTAGNSIPNFKARETQVGRVFDVAKRYHDFSNNGGNGVFPTAEEKDFADGGRILHVAWETKIYGSVAAGMPQVGSNNTYSFDLITTGKLDGYIDATAARFKSFGHPFFIDFNHEQDDSTALGGSNVSRASAGDSAGFVAAYRHLVARFRAAGVTNAIWVLTFAGFQSQDGIYKDLYPGDDVVDVIGHDPYNHVPTSWILPAPLFHRFYDRLDAGLLGAAAAAKPRALSEYGCIADTTGAGRRPAWFNAIPAALKEMPQYKVVEYFDSSSWGTIGNDPDTVAAFAAAGHDAYVNRPHGR